MNTNKKTARIVGVLFILGFAGVVTALLAKPILDSPDYLIKISDNEDQIIVGALFQFIMAVACAGIGIALYPVLRRYNEGLALGAAGFRIIEAVFDIVGVVILLLLVTLSQEFVKAGAPESSYFQTAGVVLVAGNAWVNNVVVLLAWCIGALMYYYLFYKTKLLPRWLSGWGLVGAILTIVGSIFVMFRLIGPFSTIQGILNAPIGLQEMVLAVWLIVKGFNQEAISSKTT
jgi:hypothetical protein